ncbi:hypothetical protein ACLOAV_006501 [Pseudogymnoascus australis]
MSAFAHKRSFDSLRYPRHGKNGLGEDGSRLYLIASRSSSTTTRRTMPILAVSELGLVGMDISIPKTTPEVGAPRPRRHSHSDHNDIHR